MPPNPIDTNASANHIVRKLLRIPLTCLRYRLGLKRKINDAAINQEQILEMIFPYAVLRKVSPDYPVAVDFFTTHHAAIKNAAIPINTFCENLTMTPALVAAGPTNSACRGYGCSCIECPSSHAPPTISEMPNFLIIHGNIISIGMATKRTNVVT